ncbi:hypothetical protein MMC09_006111 [Bachmanniomyces sp. S44760]|nr:hypothetical protein [Bachmanniomyces sp. S44760]
MSQFGASESFGGANSRYASGAERGARRKKLAGYLKAANELRQSYQQSYTGRGGNGGEADEDDPNVPGAFPDGVTVRKEDVLLTIFPSYARRHEKKRDITHHDLPGASQDIRDTTGGGDADYWRKEWEKYEDENAIVDVDIRGWIYMPNKGPMTRKNRLLMGLARHLSGIPAPSGGSGSTSRATSTTRDRIDARTARSEEKLVEMEADSIERKGAQEADVAGRGGYSEDPDMEFDKGSIYSAESLSRSPSPSKYGFGEPRPGQFPHAFTNSSLQDDDRQPGSLRKRSSWNQPADMSPAELSVANAHLLARLQPFLTVPLINKPLTIFFYNDSSSRSRTVSTNESGHFNLRAALDFTPTHVRVLASDRLSAIEEVQITEPSGVSLISDIDDTIKHSAIGSGAKEIFRNTFIRELKDLTIDGVREWYKKMSEMGVQMHYVSNAPWQLYPVLVTFFDGAGLPRGSFHLKQYSGMLQGIFEPVAERKKGTLERILRDFPERRFILVGDSGEADLELYTEIVLANPGKILGVFIRDVTTTKGQGFFDSSMGVTKASKSPKGSRSPILRGRVKTRDGISPNRLSSKPDQRPQLPPRLPSEPNGPVMGNLIDFDEEPEPATNSMSELQQELTRESSDTANKTIPPRRPSKPLALRSISNESSTSLGHSKDQQLSTSAPLSTRRGPPPPPKPRRLSNAQEPSTGNNQPLEPSPLSQTTNLSPPGSRATSLERQSYRAAVRNKVASAYNSLPSPYAYFGSGSGSSTTKSAQNSPNSTIYQRNGNGTDKSTSTKSSIVSSASNSAATGGPKSAPPLPPRRALTSAPTSAVSYASNRLSEAWSYNSSSSSPPPPSINDNTNTSTSEDISSQPPLTSTYPPPSTPNKKVELWLRRWARAKEIMDERGVLLRDWRVGEDVMDEAVALVDRAERESRELVARRERELERAALPKWTSGSSSRGR